MMFCVLNSLTVFSDCTDFSSLNFRKSSRSLLYLPRSTPNSLINLSKFSNPFLNLSTGPADKSSVISATICLTLGITVLAAASNDPLACVNIALPIPVTISAISFLPPSKLYLTFGNAIIFYSYLFLCIDQTKQHQHQLRY